MDITKKRKELLRMDDKAFLDRILAFPDRERLNRDEDGKRRKYPSAEMAVRARRSMENNPDWQLSNKQKFVMADSFARYSTDEVKIAGIKFAKADPRLLAKEEVKKEGVKAEYSMEFHLEPEPDNQYDINAVAVYVDNADGEGRTKVGYVPAAYTGIHPIKEPMNVKGTLTDHSNGHFKTISYVMDMDTEAVDKKVVMARDPRKYTYQMPFLLNGVAGPHADEYLNGQRDWAQQLNNELEYWGVNGHADSVIFDFPTTQTGRITVESSAELNNEAMQICGSYFRYSLESGISGDLKRDGLVTGLSRQSMPSTPGSGHISPSRRNRKPKQKRISYRRSTASPKTRRGCLCKKEGYMTLHVIYNAPEEMLENARPWPPEDWDGGTSFTNLICSLQMDAMLTGATFVARLGDSDTVVHLFGEMKRGKEGYREMDKMAGSFAEGIQKSIDNMSGENKEFYKAVLEDFDKNGLDLPYPV